ncbi:MAG: hypothetical protein ACYDAG_08190, partial [Chloroflexota bacterium]
PGHTLNGETGVVVGAGGGKTVVTSLPKTGQGGPAGPAELSLWQATLLGACVALALYLFRRERRI